jgi:glucan endo-1,3-alpha-glucosidase
VSEISHAHPAKCTHLIDYGESHYVGPIRADQPNSQGWVNGYPHTAWLPLINFYAQAFRTGSYPSISSDSMWLWSRPHPKAANPTAPTLSRPNYWDTTEDNLYAIVLLSSAATVTINSGANTGTWNLQAGVNKLSLASAPGAIGGKIVRSGKQVKSFDSTGQFTYTNTPQDYSEFGSGYAIIRSLSLIKDYNYWVVNA